MLKELVTSWSHPLVWITSVVTIWMRLVFNCIIFILLIYHTIYKNIYYTLLKKIKIRKGEASPGRLKSSANDSRILFEFILNDLSLTCFCLCTVKASQLSFHCQVSIDVKYWLVQSTFSLYKLSKQFTPNELIHPHTPQLLTLNFTPRIKTHNHHNDQWHNIHFSWRSKKHIYIPKIQNWMILEGWRRIIKKKKKKLNKKVVFLPLHWQFDTILASNLSSSSYIHNLSSSRLVWFMVWSTNKHIQ